MTVIGRDRQLVPSATPQYVADYYGADVDWLLDVGRPFDPPESITATAERGLDAMHRGSYEVDESAARSIASILLGDIEWARRAKEFNSIGGSSPANSTLYVIGFVGFPMFRRVVVPVGRGYAAHAGAWEPVSLSGRRELAAGDIRDRATIRRHLLYLDMELFFEWARIHDFDISRGVREDVLACTLRWARTLEKPVGVPRLAMMALFRANAAWAEAVMGRYLPIISDPNRQAFQREQLGFFDEFSKP